MNFDYNQEQKDKYAYHIRKCAEAIKTCEKNVVISKLNNLWCFLDGCGYSETTIRTLKDSIDHFCKYSDIENIVNCINDFAYSVTIMELPQHKNNPSINISNSNSQVNNVKIIENALSNKLNSAQIEELKELLRKESKRGDIKKWFTDLGANTLGGILSTLITNTKFV